MPKPLPPQTVQALSPPANASFPYVFFEDVAANPFQPGDASFNLCNAWWLMDAAFLAYSDEATIKAEFLKITGATVQTFFGRRSTQCYVVSTNQWIVLAFRGTQVDDFWQAVVDWTTDAELIPVHDAHGDRVHAGFKSALEEVWDDVSDYILSLQSALSRPLWITGHSLGAALATVAANLCSDDPALGFVGLYTYGSPRVGDRGFGALIPPSVVYRFQNDSDIVTQVPFGFGFHHIGAVEFIDGAGHLHPNVNRATQLFLQTGGALSSVAALSVAGLLSGGGGSLPLPGFLADHAPINYAILVWNCYEAI